MKRINYVLNTNWVSDFDLFKNSPLLTGRQVCPLKREEVICKIRKPIPNLYKITYLLLLALTPFLFSCNNVTDSAIPASGEWLIPSDQVFDGGPGRDGIPSLEFPEIISLSSVNYLFDEDLVIGVKSGNDVRAYPHKILDWHEVINDKVGNKFIAVTYCPLTGTAIGWNRVIDGKETTFGVSGLLYNTNLIPYDRATKSNWSQMLLKSVNGENIGKEIGIYRVVETTWATWKVMYPNSRVVSTNTGFSRNYQNFPYGDYRTNDNNIIFPVSPNDTRLPKKERVLGIISNGTPKAYRFSSFAGGITVINDNVGGEDIVIAGSKDKNFLVAYKRKSIDGKTLQFSAIQNDSTSIMKDDEGNKYNIFGEVISGNRTNQKLSATNSYIAYWFAWGAFYNNSTIY